MNLNYVKTIKNLILKHNVELSKVLGQNFLIDALALNKIIKSAELTSKDVVLEVGPGIGNLTKELAKRVKRVIAVEKDKTMVKILKETLKDYKNVEVVHQDIRSLNLKSYILNRHYKVVANIPYYLTSYIIRKLLELKNKPSLMILMVQKEVAQRICSAPPKMSLLAVSVQFYAKAKIVSYITKKSFWPSPKVDSATIKIDTRYKKQETGIDTEKLFKVVRAGFSQPRKQLSNNLSKSLSKSKGQVNLWLLKNKISPEQRAETLKVGDWINLAKDFVS